MAVITAKALVRKAKLTQSKGSFSGGGATVGITPDTIELAICISFWLMIEQNKISKLTTWLLHTTAMTLSGCMPDDWGLKEGLLPELPKTTYG